MGDIVVLGDRDGNYYAFPAEKLEAARTTDEAGEYFAVSPDELAAAKVPEEGRPDVESALDLPEVAGFGEPIPGIDIKLGKNPGGSFSMMGSVSASALPGQKPYGTTRKGQGFTAYQ